MKNHFYIGYVGNKRQEVEHILENIDLTNITTIIEPFCGTSAMSYYIHTKYPNKFNYILNDNDQNLMKLYEIAKNGAIDDFFNRINNLCFNEQGEFINKERYKELVNVNDVEGWYIGHKYYCMVSGLYPKYRKVNPIKKELGKGLTDFLKTDNVKLSCIDAVDLVDQYKDDEKCLIFLDPPYINLCNDFYNCGGGNIYEYLNEKREIAANPKSKVVAVVNETWLNDIIFFNYKCIKYSKKYQLGVKKNKKVMHCLYTNQKSQKSQKSRKSKSKNHIQSI